MQTTLVIYTYLLQEENPSLKDSVIVQAIVSNVVRRCGCAFTEDHITERGFQCFLSSPQAVTYRARLRGTGDATAADLLQDIEEWVQGGATISIQLQRFSVDARCDAGIDSFTESECSGSDITEAVIIGAVIGVILVLLVLVVIVIVVLILVRRKRQASLNLTDLK